MDAANVARPAVVSAQAATVRAESLVSINRVRTELPLTEAVASVAKSDAVRLDLSNAARDQARREAMLRDAIQRNVTIDPRTRTVVFQAVDPATGQVLRQLPDEASLKLRAQVREVAMRRDRQSDEASPRHREGNGVEREA